LHISVQNYTFPVQENVENINVEVLIKTVLSASVFQIIYLEF